MLVDVQSRIRGEVGILDAEFLTERWVRQSGLASHGKLEILWMQAQRDLPAVSLGVPSHLANTKVKGVHKGYRR